MDETGDKDLGSQVTLDASSAPAGDRAPPSVVVWLSHAPGDRIAGRYQLIRTLDQGGMGVVWVAHHLGLDVHVALKLLHPELGSPHAADRLVQEAQAAARLHHPAIVKVLDVGRTDEGDPFLVMELLDGESLAETLRRERRIEVVRALRVILPIADALSVMHAKGIVHRDVKPENIFLARGEGDLWQPKLIDFGLARLDERTVPRITRRGAVVGTPAYLSPERMYGEDADPGDDAWSLCIVLYEMLAGVRPFEGDHPADLYRDMTTHAPSPLAFHGVAAPELWKILERGLRPGGGRWSSVRDLGKALAAELSRRGATHDISGISLGARWLDGDPGPAEPPPFRVPDHEVATTRVARGPAREMEPTRPQRPALVGQEPADPPADEGPPRADVTAPPSSAPVPSPPRDGSLPPLPLAGSPRALWLVPALGLCALGALVWLLRSGTAKGRPPAPASSAAAAALPAPSLAQPAPPSTTEPASTRTPAPPAHPRTPHSAGTRAAPTVVPSAVVVPSAPTAAVVPSAPTAEPAPPSHVHDDVRDPYAP